MATFTPKFTREAIKAKCRDCMGNYDDGHRDCQVTACPLYSWMPYRKLDPGYAWTKDGGADLANYRRKSREISISEREAIAERFARAKLEKANNGRKQNENDR